MISGWRSIGEPGRLQARIALVTYFVLMAVAVAQLIAIGRPWAALAALPAVLAARLRARLLAIGIISSAMLLRLAYIGAVQFDPIVVTQQALERALSGESPYGVGYAPEGNPFPYGPLALVWWAPGPIVEIIAAALLFVLLAFAGAWVTLAVLAGTPFFMYLTVAGNNDYSPALLLAAGLLIVSSRPVLGGALVAVSAALKPYSAAWFGAIFGLGGVPAGIALLVVSAVLWSPLLLWGVAGFFASLAMVAASRITPLWQYVLAGLLTAGSALLRSWRMALITGGMAFSAALFSPGYLHLGYLVTLVTIAGLALERQAGFEMTSSNEAPPKVPVAQMADTV